jgi:hypothetical protein
MAPDHFVPQVYLKQWADDANKGLLRAIRKSDLKQFTPGTKAVCAMSGGNTNPFLQPQRAIEEFLAAIEPKYEWAVRTFIDGEMHRDPPRQSSLSADVNCTSLILTGDL